MSDKREVDIQALRVVCDELLQTKATTPAALKILALLGDPVVDVNGAFRAGTPIRMGLQGKAVLAFVSSYETRKDPWDGLEVRVEFKVINFVRREPRGRLADGRTVTEGPLGHFEVEGK